MRRRNRWQLHRSKKKYNLELENLKKKVDLDNLYNKILRLHVLTNSYLSDDLRLEVMVFSRLFECIIITVRTGNFKDKKEDYCEGFPTIENLRKLVGNLAKKLILKINLGGDKESTHRNDLSYRDNIFKRNLKLK